MLLRQFVKTISLNFCQYVIKLTLWRRADDSYNWFATTTSCVDYLRSRWQLC